MDIQWWIKLLKVLWKSLNLIVYCIYMRIHFILDPSARKRDLEKITAGYNLPREGLKYIEWRNEYTVSNFFYTWNMVYDDFVSQLQDINKTAKLYEEAPNPIVHVPSSEETVRLLSVASKGVPLVINFGSCT